MQDEDTICFHIEGNTQRVSQFNTSFALIADLQLDIGNPNSCFITQLGFETWLLE